MKREELLKQESYWVSKIQIKLYSLIESYRKKNKLTKSRFAEQLGVTKGYITQVLNGDFDHKLSKLVNLSMAVGKVPVIEFKDLDKIIDEENQGMLKFKAEVLFTKESILSEPNMTQVDLPGEYQFSPELEGAKPTATHYS